MSSLGRETIDPVQRLIKAVERLADANEEIVKLAKQDEVPVIEMTPGPAYCPHCGEHNPRIVSRSGGDGMMAEFVLSAECQKCGLPFYATVEGWQVFKSVDEVREHQKGG